MMHTLRVLSIFLFLIPLSLYAKTSNISGHYRCQGDDFLNHTTFDEPTYVEKSGDTFLFTWTNKNLIFYGTAILQDKTLSAVFWESSNHSSPGIVTYQVLPNGDLKGKWTIKGSKKVGDEYCTRLKK